MMHPADHLFQRFCQTGDPSALAEVFDHCAPELLRVAMHMVGDSATAEDLVQETFVLAIEKRQRHEAGRAVLPWLLGILANLVRRDRRARRELDAQRLLLPGSEDPSAAAERSEFLAAFGQAIGKLPETYRPVISLHLQSGLTAKEIGEALGRPAGTVRTQVVRGMELLRKSLPLGVTGLGAVVLTPVRGIAAMRQQVLAKISTEAVTGATVGLLGIGTVIVMKKTLLGVLAATLLVGALTLGYADSLFAERGGGMEMPAPVFEPVALETSSSDRVVQQSEEGEGESAEQREELVLPEPQLQVQVSYERDGSPAAGVRVFSVRPGSRAEILAEAITNETGLAIFTELRSVRSGSPARIFLATDHGTTSYPFSEATFPGNAKLTLPIGVSFAGRVVNESGRAIAGASILGTYPGGWSEQGARLLATSDENGRYAISDMDSDHKIRIWAFKEGWSRSRYEESYRRPGNLHEKDLVLAQPGLRLTGEVIGLQGLPMPDVEVKLVLRGLGGPPYQDFSVRSDEAGRFSVEGLPSGVVTAFAFWQGDYAKKKIGEMTMDLPKSVGRAEAKCQMRLGESSHLLLTLRRGATIRGRVHDQLGRGLASKSIGARLELTDPIATFASGYTITDAEGRYEMLGLVPGRYVLNAGNVQHIKQTVTLKEGEVFDWNPILEALVDQELFLLDQDHRPLVGWGVRAHRSAPDRLGGGFATRQALGRGTTDEAGLTILRAPDGPAELHVFSAAQIAMNPWSNFPATRVVDFEFTGQRQKIIVADASAQNGRVIGQITDPEGSVPDDIRLRLQVAGERDGMETPITPGTGAFEFGSLPKGNYSLHLYRTNGFDLGSIGEHTLGPDEIWDLGEYRMEAFASLLVRVRDAAGKSVPNLSVRLPKYRDWLTGATLRHAEEPGSYSAVDLHSGDFDMQVFGPGIMPQHLPVRLRSGQDLELDVVVQSSPNCSFEISFEVTELPWSSASLQVFNDRGEQIFIEVVTKQHVEDEARVIEIERGLAPGRYRVLIDDHHTRKQIEQDFEVTREGATVKIEF